MSVTYVVDPGPRMRFGAATISGLERLDPGYVERRFQWRAGEAYDKCYHKACDDLANVSEPELDKLSDAAAHAVLHFGTELPVPVVTAFRSGAGRGASAVPLESLPFRGEGQYQN